MVDLVRQQGDTDERPIQVFGGQPHPQPPDCSARTLELLKESRLETACRLVVRERLDDMSILPSLGKALSLAALESRWGGRARSLLDMCGILSEQSPHLVAERHERLIHIYPKGMEALAHYELPALGKKTLCDLEVSAHASETNMQRVHRGAWLHPEEVLGERWAVCPTCATHASEFPDCQEETSYSVFGRTEFSGVWRSLSSVLQDDILADLTCATLTHARTRAGAYDKLIIHAVAMAAAAGGQRTWERALCVSESSWNGKGVTFQRVHENLGKRFRSEKHLDASDWEGALSEVVLTQARGRRSPKQTARFRRHLWQISLERKMGTKYQYDGTCF